MNSLFFHYRKFPCAEIVKLRGPSLSRSEAASLAACPVCDSCRDSQEPSQPDRYTASMMTRSATPTLASGAATIWLAAWFGIQLPPAAAGEPAAAVHRTLFPTAAFEPLLAKARRAGLRVLSGRHLVLVTDRPLRHGDGVADLPGIFDEAFPVWCRHYGLDPADRADWLALGCLVVDRDRFRVAGLLPDQVPDFTNGYCALHRFWLADQSNPDYRRHLLLHEGVHAFTTTLLRLDTPTWYTEGIAEWLATHRLAANSPSFQHTPIPASPADVEQLGRIETLARLRASGEAPRLGDVFQLQPTLHGTITSYASAWAAVAFLAGHPRHAAAFADTEKGPLDDRFTARLTAHPDWNPVTAQRDFAAFIADLDYGYPFDRMVIDWSAGRPLTSPGATFAVEAGRGWQNTGWQLKKGNRYQLRAEGRCLVGRLAGPAGSIELQSEADGISIDWYRGHPLGCLLAAQWDETPASGGIPRFTVHGAGSRFSFVAATDGPLFCRINNRPANLGGSQGRLKALVAPDETEPVRGPADGSSQPAPPTRRIVQP